MALGSGEKLPFVPAVTAVLRDQDSAPNANLGEEKGLSRRDMIVSFRKFSLLPSTLMFSFCLLFLSHPGQYLSQEGIAAVGV